MLKSTTVIFDVMTGKNVTVPITDSRAVENSRIIYTSNVSCNNKKLTNFKDVPTAFDDEDYHGNVWFENDAD